MALVPQCETRRVREIVVLRARGGGEVGREAAVSECLASILCLIVIHVHGIVYVKPNNVSATAEAAKVNLQWRFHAPQQGLDGALRLTAFLLNNL